MKNWLGSLSDSYQRAGHAEDERLALADELGLKFYRPKNRTPAKMSGVIEGHKVSATLYTSRPVEIEVRFDSGFAQIGIYERARKAPRDRSVMAHRRPSLR